MGYLPQPDNFDLGHFLQTYGSAIGPTAAFIFGFFALFLKHRVDRRLEARAAARQYTKLRRTIFSSAPPRRFYIGNPIVGSEAESGINSENIKIYLPKILSVGAFIENIEEDVYKYGAAKLIIQFTTLKWKYTAAIENVRKIASRADEVTEEDFISINKDYLVLNAVCLSPLGLSTTYIESDAESRSL
jgi:hypothetical protein